MHPHGHRVVLSHCYNFTLYIVLDHKQLCHKETTAEVPWSCNLLIRLEHKPASWALCLSFVFKEAIALFTDTISGLSILYPE